MFVSTNMKKQGRQRMILFIVELFAHVKHFSFYIKPSFGWLVGWLVVFYGMSTLIGYLILNSVYMYLSNMIFKWIVCRQQFLNKLELIYLHTLK